MLRVVYGSGGDTMLTVGLFRRKVGSDAVENS